MSWPRFSLQYRHTIFAALIAIIILGVQARYELPVQLFPDTDPPVVTVITPYPGVAASDVAKNLSKPLEEEFTGIDGVARVSSTSQTGLSVVKVQFHFSRAIGEATVDVQNAISRVRGRLPGAIGEPQVLQFSSSDKPIITLAVNSARLDLEAVRELADNALRDRLQLVEGVSAVDVFGGHKRQLEVQVRRDSLRDYHLSLDQIASTLQQWNLAHSGGRIQHGDLEAVVRFDQPLSAAPDLAQLVVKRDGDYRVRLGEVADIAVTTQEPRSAYHFNGRPAIAIQVLKRDEANTVEVAGRVHQVLQTLRLDYPYLQFDIADDDSEFTGLVISNMTATVVTAIALVIMVVFLFLAELRQAAIIAISIPVAFLMTFVLMQWAGIELNLVTMSAIILSIGLLVDDGIVVLENIHRHLTHAGKSPVDAAIEGTEEIFLADLAGTLTTMAVLIPLAFLGGFVGRLFGPLAWTLVFALGSSFLVSVTLIPVLSAIWLSPDKQADSRAVRWLRPFNALLEGLQAGYLSILDSALRHPWRTLGLALLLLIGSVRLMAMLGSEMLPKFDAGNFQVMLDTAPGTPLQTTLEAVAATERLLLAQPGVTRVSTQVGYEIGVHYLGSRGAMGANQAEFTVNLTPRTERAATVWEIMTEVRQGLTHLPGVTLAVLKEKGGTAVSTTLASIDVRLSGPDLNMLDQLGHSVLAQIQPIPGVRDAYLNWSLDTPELKVQLDPVRVQELGLTGEAVARTVHEAVDGKALTPWRQADRRDLEIILRYAESERRFLEHLDDIEISGPAGSAPLRELAQAEYRLGPRVVTREDAQRTLDVLAYHQGRPLSEIIAEVRDALADQELPAGYSLAVTGEQSDFEDARQRMLKALAGGILAVYLVLVAQFRSFKHPFTIMMAVPFQFIGVALALLLASKYLSMPAMLGIILLVGTVVNNSIVLIDYILQRRRQGIALEPAIREAVAVRFRPIMMTALSDVAGMLPLALELAVGAERFSPIATAVIGGILAATLLTLVIIPVLFRLLERSSSNIVG